MISDKIPAILVVDDFPHHRELLERLLGQEGYRVITASDADEALRLIQCDPVDLAVLDVMMPGMNGYDLCRRLKASHGKKFFPVILLSALHELDNRITGIEAGADDFLPKPFHTAELLTRIRSLLKLKKLQGELEHSEDIIMTLAIAIEARDIYTKGHSERVGRLSMEFASFIGLPEEDQRLLRKAGILHDIGKIGTDDYVLHKNGRLSREELKLIQEHVLVGENICMPLQSARDILPIIRHHHERWDGTGFPDGLKGEEIPFFARLIALTDTFDAMVSARPYRPEFSAADAIRTMEIEKDFGQWDPELTEKFIDMVNGRLSALKDRNPIGAA